MLTVSKLKNLLNEEFLSSLKKNEGITEFFMIGDISIGISFEDGDVNVGEEEERYILNVFFNGDYINIDYEPSEKGLNDTVLNEVCKKFNDFFDVRTYLASEGYLNYTEEEMEKLIGTIKNPDELYKNIEKLANKPVELYQMFEKCFSPEEIGNMLFYLL